MIKVLFFAQIRELVGTDYLEVSSEYPTVAHLRQALLEKGERWKLALEESKLLVAVNQSFVHAEHPLRDGDEVAFFPPVTGG
ncbi:MULTISPECIES: molybdopterin synthase sulfur carrier subunit [Xenorhabdus]|uniref:molybdopterin synthase sulfur carrier subunit n=1 Tax=Xenorhabdus TaxID=626 RepID=UPI0006475834|nr:MULTISPECIES: molybdopterin synthase sulfur carrier subunit [Xenorhabdus]MBC8946473.1 molybdopterin synthase sulfur carrier subunit [Xenorhabdus indica]